MSKAEIILIFSLMALIPMSALIIFKEILT